jgi:hypothetical protein
MPEVIGLVLGGIASAFYGTSLVTRLSDHRLTRLIALLLAALGVLLIAEAFIPFDGALLLPASELVRWLAGVAHGLGVGVVSSMLGVAGGELLIPVLVFVFGADIKTAGTASLVISLAIVARGVALSRRGRLAPARRRAADHRRHGGGLADRRRDRRRNRRLCARRFSQSAAGRGADRRRRQDNDRVAQRAMTARVVARFCRGGRERKDEGYRAVHRAASTRRSSSLEMNEDDRDLTA